MDKLAGLLLLLTLAGGAAWAETPAEVVQYCSQVAAYAAQHRSDAVLFSAIPQNPSPADDHWKRDLPAEFATAVRNANSTARVTTREGHAVYADFTYQNEFGDSKETAQYCFRPDGTLAQLHAELDSYHGGMKVVRDFEYDAAGKVIGSRSESFDLQTGKPRSLPSDFWDQPPPVYHKASEMPLGDSK